MSTRPRPLLPRPRGGNVVDLCAVFPIDKHSPYNSVMPKPFDATITALVEIDAFDGYVICPAGIVLCRPSAGSRRTSPQRSGRRRAGYLDPHAVGFARCYSCLLR